jgi:pimeloyl-ACP methyl ester carboxylesterase
LAEWSDGYWWSRDGLRLHYRDYAGPSDKPPVICLAGLTRNARDFSGIADHLAGRWRVIAIDLRGRGESAYATDAMSYVPLTYLHDIEALLTTANIGRFVTIGTSLGGIISLLLAAAEPGRLAGAVINDVGPTIDEAGLARIRSYVGRQPAFPTWLHAARAIAEVHGPAFPGYQLEDWLVMAKRLCRLTGAGRIVYDYDAKIAEPFRIPNGEAGFDMWSTLDRLRDVPALLIRGALSDILSRPTAARMTERLPAMELVTVPNVGHAPSLDEPECVEAIDRLLARVA